MQGKKTHEQQVRILERKSDVPSPHQNGGDFDAGSVALRSPDQDARQSEFSVSRGGMNQESRDHNKHNDPGQTGHKPQKFGPANEKH
jgi:hypothetical protein